MYLNIYLVQIFTMILINFCSVDNQLKYAQVQLERLKKTNVFNATFHIW